MDTSDIEGDLPAILLTEEQIHAKIAERRPAGRARLRGRDPLLVGVLKGAVMVMADFARELRIPATMDWMAVSSYGSGTKSSGVVRILKDLDTDLHGRDVIIVEDIIDSGLTLSWLLGNLATAAPPASRSSRSSASPRRPRWRCR